MPLPSCPHCRVQYDPAGIAPGTQVQCGGCGKLITVPGGAAGAPVPLEPVPLQPVGRAGGQTPRRGRYRDGPAAEELSGGGARGRYAGKKRSNPLPLILGGVGGLILLGVVLFFMFGGDSIDVDNATPHEKTSYVLAYTAARFTMKRGKQLPDIDETIAKVRAKFDEDPKMRGKFSEKYFRAGWNDGVKARDPKITFKDIPKEFTR